LKPPGGQGMSSHKSLASQHIWRSFPAVSRLPRPVKMITPRPHFFPPESGEDGSGAGTMPHPPQAIEVTDAAAKPHRVSTYAFSGCLAPLFPLVSLVSQAGAWERAPSAHYRRALRSNGVRRQIPPNPPPRVPSPPIKQYAPHSARNDMSRHKPLLPQRL